jgi:CheY-like chemotaxis protein
MSRLVDDLLDVSRVGTGKIELRRDRVPLSAAVNSAVEACRPLIEESRHQLSVSMPMEPIHVDADLTRLSQVISNLINNAAKYTEPAGRIWVNVDREGDDAVVRVRDTGVGIPPDMLCRIFELFAQVDSSLDRAKGGLGIGLTLARRLVEMHGGSLEAASAGLGTGSEFTVRLPAPPHARAKASLDSAREEVVAGSTRVLVVDDNRDSADTMAALLRAKGHEVRVAYDGVEGAGAATAFKPDVLLLDIGLPKLNGLDLAREIRGKLGHDVLLIAITGMGQDEDRRRSMEAGFDHHFTKPVDLAELDRLLAQPRGQ